MRRGGQWRHSSPPAEGGESEEEEAGAEFWYRPHNTAIFVPGTPGGQFAKVLQGIVNEELGRLGMSGRVVQTSGVSLKSQLVKLDKTGCVYKEDGCWPCRSGVKGASHTRRGALYSGQCTLCKETGKTSSYFGESGYNSVNIA